MLNCFEKQDFCFGLTTAVTDHNSLVTTFNHDPISEFDKSVIQVVLAADDGSGWAFLSFNKELKNKLKTAIDNDSELLTAFKRSLQRWSRIEITAKRDNHELFTRIISSFYFREKDETVNVVINLSKEFIVSVPPTLPIFVSSKEKGRK